MTELKSNPVFINAENQEVYDFLKNFANFGKLLPEQITNWQVTSQNCSFTIQGMADLALTMGHNKEFSMIIYESTEPSPFRFSIQFDLGTQDAGTMASCTLNAKLSPVIKLMASRPLQNFVNLLVEKLKETLEME